MKKKTKESTKSSEEEYRVYKIKSLRLPDGNEKTWAEVMMGIWGRLVDLEKLFTLPNW